MTNQELCPAEKENKFISAVAYLYRDEANVEHFFKTVTGLFSEKFTHYELIFVNDGCDAGSIELLKKTAAEHQVATTVVNMGVHQGLELAMNAGVDLAVGDLIFEFDSLLVDYDQDLIYKVYLKALEGFDVTSAIPEKKGRLTSRLFYLLYNRFSGSSYKLRTERFRVITRRAINRVEALSKIISYRKAAYAESGLKISSINYIPHETGREITSDNYRFRKDTAIDSLVIFTDLAYKGSMALTILLFLGTVFGALFALFQYFGANKPVEGWTTLMLMLSGGFSGIFLILAVVIKYLAVIVRLVLKKQKYMVESVERE